MDFVSRLKLNKNQLVFISVLLLFSFFLRLSYGISAEHDNPLRADALNYAKIALNLVESGTYTYKDDLVTSKLITPGFPFIVAFFAKLFDGFPGAYYAVIGFQIIISTLVVLFSYLLSLRVMNNIAACVTAIAVSISPHLIISSSYFLTETSHSFFVLLGIWLLVVAIEKKMLKIALLAGLVFGYAALIRPAVLLFPIAALLIFWWKYKAEASPRLLFAFLLTTALVWLPWQIWEAESDESNSRAVFLLGAYPDMTYQSPAMRGYAYREDPQFQAMRESWSKTREVLGQRFSEAPFTYISWYLIGKPVTLWSAYMVQGQGGPFIYPITSSVYDDPGIYSLSLFLMMSLHGLLFFAAVLVVVVASLRMVFSDDKPDLVLAMVVLFVLYHTGVHTVLAPLPRYSTPYYPFLFMLAVYGCTAVFEKIKVVARAKASSAADDHES